MNQICSSINIGFEIIELYTYATVEMEVVTDIQNIENAEISSAFCKFFQFLGVRGHLHITEWTSDSHRR